VLRLFDTATGRVSELELRDPGRVSMYVCGPTVYGEPHLGHGRFNLIWDVIRRYLTWCGLDVAFVSNVTDIDDKIIRTAEATGVSPGDVAARYEEVWWDAMGRLGIERPTADPHATAYVDRMVDLIAELVDRGHAYVGGDGVYFAAESIEGYGLLARQPLESLRAGARVEVGEEAGKRAPVDFALWKRAKPGEPRWPSPWGDGRPGWHTECVVMSLDLLGDGFDVHGGGNDLAFPHHENERAQAVGAGRRFARHWVHSGMVETKGGEKMSKSAGNTLSLVDLVDAHDPRSLRLLVLQSHYRGPMTVTRDNMAAADEALRRLDTFARDFAGARGAVADLTALSRFRERMDDDLDSPRAIAELFDLTRAARAAGGERATALAAAALEVANDALGLRLGGVSEEVPDEVAARGRERDEARRSRDWARADRIRAELGAAGWVVEDGPAGTSIRR